MSSQASLRVNKMCAFCKHWYDPTNSAIEPKAPQLGIWQYDEKAVKKCLLKGLNTPARQSCKKYECKV